MVAACYDSMTTGPGTELKIDIGFIYFRTLTLDHLDAAWFSLSQQDLSRVGRVLFLDNNTNDAPAHIHQVLDRYPLPVPVAFESDKHGDPHRTHSWSVNHLARTVSAPLFFFTRADYILDADCLHQFYDERIGAEQPSFVTSFAYHMAYDDRGDQRIDAFRDIEVHRWRERGAAVLLDEVNGWRVDSSHLDAGVWLLDISEFNRAGGLNEQLSAWGYQQTVFQKTLRDQGTPVRCLPQFLYFHQHHAAPRSYDLARAELARHWGTVEDLATFRPSVTQFTGSVCDELDRRRPRD